MKRLAILLVLMFSASAAAEEFAYIPKELRQRNRGGSCVHASTVMPLRYLGMYREADQWWSRYRGGESAGPHRRKMETMKLKYAMTTDGDERLLEYAIANRRPALVTWRPNHVVNFLGRVERDGRQWAVILDNNRITKFIYQPYPEFIREWKRRDGWGAVILSGKVPPPLPE